MNFRNAGKSREVIFRSLMELSKYNTLGPAFCSRKGKVIAEGAIKILPAHENVITTSIKTNATNVLDKTCRFVENYKMDKNKMQGRIWLV